MTGDRTRAEGAALVAVAAAWILLLYAGFNPLMYGDSPGYVAPGCMLWGPIGVRDYDGARTPLYPLFLSALQHLHSGTCLLEPAPGALELVTAVQLLLHVASIAYLYRALAGTGRLVRLLGIAAIAFSPLQALATRQILSEALAGPLLLAFLAHLLRFARGRSERDATLAFALLALLTLTRPNVLVPLLPAAALVPWLGGDRRRLLARAGLLVGLPLLLLACFNLANRGHFKLTNFDGFAKTHVVYNLFDRVHEEDRVLGEIMSRQHQLDLANGAADGQVVWRSMPEIWKALDRMPFEKRARRSAGNSDLNAYLDEVSGYLIREHPDVVVDNARSSFLRLFHVGVLAVPPHGQDPRSPGHDGNVRSDAVHRVFLGAQDAYNGIVRLAVALLPILLVVGLYLRGPARMALPVLFYAAYLGNMAMVAMLNVIQARYLTLVQPLLALSLCMSLQCLLDELRALARPEAA